jgi:predicted SnoaL-like aldol condensation-catalyzing enzyme
MTGTLARMTLSGTEREVFLRRFYRLIDEKKWDEVTASLSDDCRWHILANNVVSAASVVGPEAVERWFREALGSVETSQEIQRIEDDGAASVVFTRATVTGDGGTNSSAWVDVFRFDGLKIKEHVSLQV